MEKDFTDLITMRHFHSQAQEFYDETQKDLKSSDDNINYLNERRVEYLKTIWSDLFASLSSNWIQSFEENKERYKNIILNNKNDLLIQCSPYIRCKESLSLLIKELEPKIAKSLLETDKEGFDFKVDWKQITIQINDLLSEINAWNWVPDYLIPNNSSEESLYLSQEKLEQLWYYKKINWWESMVDLLVRCKLLKHDFDNQNISQLWISHQLFLNQFVNLLNNWSYYGYAKEDNFKLKPGMVSLFKFDSHKQLFSKQVWLFPTDQIIYT